MTDAWTSFVEELSNRRDVIEGLMGAHRPDDFGRCIECTTPGRGTPQAEWPCSLWTLADAARQIRAKRRAQG